ncbi:hypothetical protein IU402_04035 [Aerococcaceae bacterium zg-BR9]|uniref:hypothetical protein n=1 Tax=Aerococcaceae bacterium zg-1292 TaxID=2774330 RepID=UPI0040647668|nr:hypothetical protein [Aerococcaceae bacterium zg-BR9]
MLNKEFIKVLGAELAELNNVLIMQRVLSQSLNGMRDDGLKMYLQTQLGSTQDMAMQWIIEKIDVISCLLTNYDDETCSEDMTYPDVIMRLSGK